MFITGPWSLWSGHHSPQFISTKRHLMLHERLACQPWHFPRSSMPHFSCACLRRVFFLTPQSLTCHAWLMSKIKHVIPQQVIFSPLTIPTQLVGTVIPVSPKRHLQPDNLTTARRFSRLDISTTTCQSIFSDILILLLL